MLGKIGQVIWTPSIPVGAPGDQPSLYSLSLYADGNVNPRLVVPEFDSSGTPLIPSYTLNVQADSPQDLTQRLQSLLTHIHQDIPAQSPLTDATATGMSPVEPYRLAEYDAPGVELSLPDQQAGPQVIASPIAFKVLQLRDDSMLQGAQRMALIADPKKALGSTLIHADDYQLDPGQFKFIDLRALDESAHFVAVFAVYQSSDASQWKQVLRVEPKGRQYALLVHLGDLQVELKGETR